MAAIGCLAPFILALIGAGLAHLLAGTAGLPWGLGLGFLLGGGIAGAFWALAARAKADD